jgi:hypothetical protein
MIDCCVSAAFGIAKVFLVWVAWRKAFVRYLA